MPLALHIPFFQQVRPQDRSDLLCAFSTLANKSDSATRQALNCGHADLLLQASGNHPALIQVEIHGSAQLKGG